MFYRVDSAVTTTTRSSGSSTTSTHALFEPLSRAQFALARRDRGPALHGRGPLKHAAMFFYMVLTGRGGG